MSENPVDIGYEETLAQLREVVDKLQDASIPLEDMISLYERGTALAARLKAQLNQARGRLDELRGEDIVQGVMSHDG